MAAAPESDDVPSLGAADAELDAWLAIVREEPGPPARELGAEGLRDISAQRTATAPRGPELREVRDLQVPGQAPVPARLYRSGPEPRPLVVFLHGGGFVFGGLESHDRLCRRLAHSAGVAVLAVDYRLAPEHPWPAAVDDAVGALRWAAEAGSELGGTGGAAAVAADSGGAVLAVLACLRVRGEGDPRPSGLILANPHLDLTLSSPSVEEKGSGWGLEASAMRWFVDTWVPDGVDLDDGRVSPFHARDLRGLPPTVLVTSEHDPLRDEGASFADRLADAGVGCRYRCEPGLVHGFLTLDSTSPACAEAGERLFEDVRQLLG
jgi:acetyl esterase